MDVGACQKCDYRRCGVACWRSPWPRCLACSAGSACSRSATANGFAYLSNNPAACANCHVMQSQYDAWVKSSHHAVATCNDCHLPHDFVGKWRVKADNGFFHSLAFTTGDVSRTRFRSSRGTAGVVQQACIYCHKDLVNHMLPDRPGGDMLSCVSCHPSVGHAQSITPRR